MKITTQLALLFLTIGLFSFCTNSSPSLKQQENPASANVETKISEEVEEIDRYSEAYVENIIKQNEQKIQASNGQDSDQSKLDNNITKTSIGGISLGMKLADVQRLYRDAKFTPFDMEGRYGIRIIEEGNAILEMYSKDDYKHIYSISALSPRFSADNGLKVGMTLNDYLSIYPNTKRLIVNEMTGEYYLKPSDLKSSNKDTDSTVYIEMNNSSKLERLEKFDGGVLSINLNSIPDIQGTVSSIQIFSRN